MGDFLSNTLRNLMIIYLLLYIVFVLLVCRYQYKARKNHAIDMNWPLALSYLGGGFYGVLYIQRN